MANLTIVTINNTKWNRNVSLSTTKEEGFIRVLTISRPTDHLSLAQALTVEDCEALAEELFHVTIPLSENGYTKLESLLIRQREELRKRIDILEDKIAEMLADSAMDFINMVDSQTND